MTKTETTKKVRTPKTSDITSLTSVDSGKSNVPAVSQANSEGKALAVIAGNERIVDHGKYLSVMGNLMSEDELLALIAKGDVQGKELRQLLHTAAMQSLAHAYANNDNFIMLQKLYDILKTNDKDSLNLWAQKNAPVRLATTEDGSKVFRKNKGDKAPDYNFAQANAVPFYDINTAEDMKEKILSQLTVAGLEDRVLKLVKEINQALEGKSKSFEVEEENKAQVIQFKNKLVAIARHIPDSEDDAQSTNTAA